MRIPYRIEQFWRILRTKSLPGAIVEEIAGILNYRELALFQRCPPHDQWHGYRVMDMLRAAGHTDSDLLIAALLHDIGKIRLRLTIWERSMIVLAGALFPQRTAAWGEGPARGLKRPFVVKVQHPAWGAEMAIAAGSTDRVAMLIRRHQELLSPEDNSEEGKLLRLLQWADDRN